MQAGQALHLCMLGRGAAAAFGRAPRPRPPHLRTSCALVPPAPPRRARCPAYMLQGRSITGELVFGYLAHQGHWDTAAAVARDVLGGAVAVSQQDVQDMQVGGWWSCGAQLFSSPGLLSRARCCGAYEARPAMAWQRYSRRRPAAGPALQRLRPL